MACKPGTSAGECPKSVAMRIGLRDRLARPSSMRMVSESIEGEGGWSAGVCGERGGNGGEEEAT